MPEDKSTISYKVWVLVESKPFEITIMVLIALNAIVLMMSVSDIVSEMFNILWWIYKYVRLLLPRHRYCLHLRLYLTRVKHMT